MRERFFARLVSGALRRHWQRSAVAGASVALSAALIAAALNLAMSIGKQTGQALRAYGANVVVLPGATSADAYFPADSLNALRRIPSARAVQGIVPMLFVLGRAGAAPVVLLGTDLAAAREVSPWWEVQPKVQSLAGARAVVGVNVARALAMRPGDQITLRVGSSHASVTVAAILSTGSSEDDRIVVDLGLAQHLSGRPGLVGLAQVSVLSRSGDLGYIVDQMAAALPDLRVQPIRQIAQAERRVLARVQKLLGLIAVIVALAAVVTVLATMSALALERRREVALMKAIGAGNHTVSRLFLSEVGALGLGGGILGYGMGWLLSQLAGRAMGASVVGGNAYTLLTTVGAAILLATAASLLPVLRVMDVEPAVALRGE